MIELDFLGLDANGENLTFNDADGNRYCVKITDTLRGALRKDVKPAVHETSSNSDSTPKAASPKEIQAYFRAGMSLSEVSELCALPPLQLSKLASPILSERNFIANQARNFHKNQDSAEMTIDEIVTARLVGRGVEPETIEWDAIRTAGTPWVFIARYLVAGKKIEAKWQVNLKAHFITPLNDEATWLTDTPIPTPNDPWRALNTPNISEISDVTPKFHPSSATPASPTAASAAQLSELSRIAALTSESAENLETEASAPAANTIDIDAMLASLDAQRGISRPAPQFSELSEFTGAHPAYSEPENAQDAQILHFPVRKAENAAEAAADSQISSVPLDRDSADFTDAANVSAANFIAEEAVPTEEYMQTDKAMPTDQTAAQADSPAENTPALLDLPEKTPQENNSPSTDQKSTKKAKGKTRKGRPEMPSWDEIIYGYAKDND